LGSVACASGEASPAGGGDLGTNDAAMDAGAGGSCSPPCFAWARLIQGPSEEDEVDAVASDAAGNAYISGKFQESLVIEGAPEPLVSRGRADVMLAKFSPAGDLVWVRHYGGISEDNVFDAACDAEGNVVLSGYFGGTVDFGGVTLRTSGPTDLDMMLLKVSPDGDMLWARSVGGVGSDGGNEVNVAPDGTIVAILDSDGPVRAADETFESESRDSYLVTFEPSDGAVRWATRVGGAGDVRGKCLAVDARGRAYLGGDYVGALAATDTGGRTMELPAVTRRDADAFLTAWDTDGALRWVKSWGAAGGDDLCKAAVAEDADTLTLVSQLSGPATLDGRAVSVARPSLLVWQLDAAGETRWAEVVTSNVSLFGAEAMTAPEGGILFGFAGRGDVVFGARDGDAVPVMRTLTSPTTVFAGYGPDGTPRAPLLPAESQSSNGSELSRSGRRVYLDVPISGEGAYRFGPDLREAGPTKDALLVAIDL
ncbi:MAG: hypothetical protein AAF447_04630, partial [Myxococcota bacterium]